MAYMAANFAVEDYISTSLKLHNLMLYVIYFNVNNTSTVASRSSQRRR